MAKDSDDLVKIDVKFPEEDNLINDDNTENNSINKVEADTKAAIYLEQLQRVQAEFENYKKRIEKERIHFMEIGNSECIANLLPVLDDFERLVQNHSDSSDVQLVEGMKMVKVKLFDTLYKQGLKPIESVNKSFDPAIHEAVATVEKAGFEDGQIIEEWQKGYLFNDNLLRPAKVIVAKSRAH